MSRVLRGVLECVRASSGAGSSPAALFAAASLSQSGWVSGTRTWASYGQDLQDEAPSTSYSTTTTRRNPRSLGRPLASSPSPYPRVSESVKPLTVQYPFPIEYDVDRTTLVRSLITGQPIGVQSLPGSIFNVPVRVDVLHRCVRYLRSLWQQGTHKAKSRAEVSGGGRKPRPQKKTGRSRQGSIRSPLWKGGGVALGPSPRSHAHQMHATTRLLGMKCALSAKVNEGRLIVLDSLLPPVASLTIGGAFEPAPSTVPPKGSSRSGGAAAAASPKTKHMRQALEALLEGVPARTVLLVDCGRDGGDGGAMLRRAADNLTWVTILAAQDVTVYHLLKHHALVVSRPALQALTARLEGALRVKRPVRSAWWLTQQAAFRVAEAKLRGVTA